MNRGSAKLTGSLLLTATTAVLVATALLQPILSGTDHLADIGASTDTVSAAVLLELLAAAASVGIAVSLYPALQKWGSGLALGSVVFRTIEAVLYVACAVSLLSLVTLARGSAVAPSEDQIFFRAVGDLTLATRQSAILAGVFAFCLGAFMYYAIFYRSLLIPRWLAGWGIAGVILMLAACVSAAFSHRPVSTYTPLVLPIAIQEMVLAVWLIARGFRATSAGEVTDRRSVLDTVASST
jgi:hypothetical protein